MNGIKELQGQQVLIQIAHKLYGDQKIKCAFQLLEDEKRLGFLVGKQEIYIAKDKIVRYGIEGNLCYFADDLMEIKIKLHEQ